MPLLPSLDNNTLGEEVAVTSTPIFEGHLSVRTDKKNWQWRLFRFDGSNFTCLSSRKVKLPPNTKERDITATTSFYSLSSPLLATPKDKNKRIVQESIELKYYQLPEWTVDVVNISSISILKRAKKNTKCFSIRTFSNQCFILKAHKQKDLERWLFVLTKMWKFTQAVRDQVMQQQQQQQQFYYPPITTNTQALIQQQVEDNTPLAHTLPIYDTKYRSPTLSSEKIRVIEEWRKSLAELMANDPCIKVSSPPPIEPIPDDDTMSVFTDMTSVSNRPSKSKRRTGVNSKRSTTSRSLRRNKTNSIAPASAAAAAAAAASQQHQEMPLEGRLVPTLKKRRSDDVRNWMNNNSSSHSGKLGRTASIGSNRKPMIQKVNPIITTNGQHSSNSVSTSPEIIHHNMNFFQDVVTVCDDETCHNHHANNISSGQLRYHTSVRGKKLIQINRGEDNGTKEQEEGVESSNIKQQRPITRRASMPLTDDNLILQQQYQYQQQQFLFDQQQLNSLQSPLQFLSMKKQQQEEEEEDISLADLQKSLRQIGIHNRSPSASSIQDLQKRSMYYNIVAPAIPPHKQQSSSYMFNYHDQSKFTDKQPLQHHLTPNNVYN